VAAIKDPMSKDNINNNKGTPTKALNHKSNSVSRDLAVIPFEDNKAIKTPVPRQNLQDLSNPTFPKLFDLAM
jgi:hypothetical protein